MTQLSPAPDETNDAAAIGASLLLADLHEAVAEASAQLATLAAATVSAAPFMPTPQAVEMPARAAEPAAAWQVDPPADPVVTQPTMTPVPEPVGLDARDPALPQPAHAVLDPSDPPSTAMAAAMPPAVAPPAETPEITFEVLPPVVADSAAPAPPSPSSPSVVWSPAPVNVPAQAPDAAAADPAAPLDIRSQPLQGPPAASAAPSPAWPPAADPVPSASSPLSGGMASAAPASRASSGPTGGDVFLDGTRVGRWLSDTLAREAGGPAQGGTGFDPRMGPTWPGALQGNGA